MIIGSKTGHKSWNSLIEFEALKLRRQNGPIPFREGERFLYDIILGLFKAGSAELIFHGLDTLDGREVYVITLETKLTNFHDKEKIYADVNNFYPVRVERDINMWGRSIEIVEDYNQNDKFVKIQKKEWGRTKVQTIHSDKKIQNAILLIYFYRNSKFKEDSVFAFNLPTKKINMKLSKIEEIRVPKGTYKAQLLKSMPGQYKVWFDTTKEKIPLRIDGMMSFTGGRMVLSEIH